MYFFSSSSSSNFSDKNDVVNIINRIVSKSPVLVMNGLFNDLKINILRFLKWQVQYDKITSR